MSVDFHIELDHSEGALLRLLGTIERRGFALLNLAADKPDEASYVVRLRLAGERDPLVLCRQLERLVEVRVVKVVPPLPEPPPPPGFQASWL